MRVILCAAALAVAGCYGPAYEILDVLGSPTPKELCENKGGHYIEVTTSTYGAEKTPTTTTRYECRVEK